MKICRARVEPRPGHFALTMSDAKHSEPSLRGCSSMVELQPSKLTMWVRFPSPAPFFGRWGCENVTYGYAQIAQLVEHTLGKGEVGSSNLLLGSSFGCRLLFKQCAALLINI